jgi:hypothetical protein
MSLGETIGMILKNRDDMLALEPYRDLDCIKKALIISD